MVYPCWLPVKINWYVKYMGRTEITGIYWQFQQLKAGFKNELENRYAQKWIKGINDIGRQPILRTYIGFKTNFVRKNILNALTSENINKQYPASGSVLIDWSLKQVCIKSRVYHPMKGCVSIANPEKIDDELQFLFHCDFHSKTRKLFFSQLCEIITDVHTLNDVDKFREILMPTNKDVIVLLF